MDKLKKEIKNFLLNEAEEEYKKFTIKITPNADNVLGVRLPKLRKYAKQLLKKDYESFLDYTPEFFEEKMLQAMLIGYSNNELKEKFKQIQNFVPQINNWAICDTFCCGLKFTNIHKATMWEFLQQYLTKDNEFENRFVFVMFLNFYIEENYLSKIFDIIENYKSDKYYAKMAVAWLISICFIKQEKLTYNFLKKTNLQKEIYNKAIQKIIESNAVQKETKEKIRKLKKPN